MKHGETYRIWTGFLFCAVWGLAPAVILGVTPVVAGDVLQGTVSASVLRVIDGDTIEVRAEIWPDIEVTASVRLAGIDAPELHAACSRERDLATAARELLARELAPATTVLLSGIIHDKYAGRVIAEVLLPEGRSAAPLLLAAGLAVGYGQERDWCAP